VIAVIYGHHLKKHTSCQIETKDAGMLDLLIMGRQLTLPLFVGTLVATWYGGILGVTEIAYKNGIYNFVTQGFFWYLTYVLFALFIVDSIEPYRATTFPDLVGKMFGPRAQKLSVFFTFFNVLPIAYTISIGILLQSIWGGGLLVNMFIGVSVVVLYSMWGGLRSVVFSDFIQFFVMYISVFLVLLFSIITFGGWSFLSSHLPASYFSPTGNHSLSVTFVWGFIALATLVDPNFYQRCFAAKSTKVAKKGIYFATFFWFCFDICTTFGAMYAKAVIPNAADSSTAYLTYAFQLLPVGLKGLFLAGIVATIFSTLDSYLFLAGTTITYDLLPKKSRWKNSKNAYYLGVIFAGLLSIFMALLFQGDIKSVWKTLGSYFASCLLFPMLFGYLRPGKISDNQFVFTCLLGIVTTSIWRVLPLSGFLAMIDALYIGIITTLLGVFLYPKKKKG
jgi:SSS family solute:Na+ symporter